MSATSPDAPSAGPAPDAGTAEAAAPSRATDGARDSEAWLRLAQEAGGICSWQWDLASGELLWSDSCHALHGIDPSVPPSFDVWIAGVHPQDRGMVERSLTDAMQGGAAAWDMEFRYNRQDDGTQRWLVGRGRILRDPASGAPVRLLGIGFDITDRREAEEQNTLLLNELDHRARNILAVVQAALRLTPKEDAERYARAVEGRVAALARAHAMLAEERWAGSELRRLLEGELAAFPSSERVRIEGPRVMLPARTCQPLAMAIHELATNAIKHGALSMPAGRLTVAWGMTGARSARSLRIDWIEAGGPPVRAPLSTGFGTRMLQATVPGQLGGTLDFDWAGEGLRCSLVLPLEAAGGRGAAD